MKKCLEILAVLMSAAFSASAHKTDLIWNEGIPDKSTGLVVNELLICNAPEGLEWDLWGCFYDGFNLPCRSVEGSMAKLQLFNGSCWRIEPVEAGDTVVLRYIDRRHKHSWHPRGFYIKMRESGEVIPVPIKCNHLQCEEPVYPEYPLVSISETDIVPAVKSVVKRKGSSKIVKTEEKIVKGLRPEGYRLSINDGKALIEASDAAGLRYGHITLEKFMENAGSDVLGNMTVEDWPDFAYRAQMVDVARLFYPLDELRKVVDVMERCKMNTLALHLTDDENWRLEIEGLPELTSFGAFHEVPERQADGTYKCVNAMTPVKAGDIGKVWGGTSGYYSREEYKDFLKYAWAHGVTVITEIDVPGHCYAAIESMKYRERTTGDASCRLVDPDDVSVYRSVQGFSDNVIDIALPSVYTFLGKVFDSIKSMYEEAGVPVSEIAIGGDEVAKGAWEGSPACIAAMKKKGYTDVHQLREDFLLKVNAMLRERGLRVSGYTEMAENLSDKTFDEIAANCGAIWVWGPLKNPKDAVIAYNLANKGMRVVIAHAGHLYFDNSRLMNWKDRGMSWAGTTDEKKVYTLLPYNLGASYRFDADGNPRDMTQDIRNMPELKRPENIIGVQGMIWGDNLWEYSDGFRMLFPKAFGAWERNWNAHPEWEKSAIADDPAFMADFEHFFSVVRQRELPYLDRKGLVYGSRPRHHNILVRDFRTVWQGEVINYNIGTAAHCPGTLSSLKKSLPDNVKLTVWADTVLCPELAEMMKTGFPDVPIVYGSLNHPNPELKKAVKESDMCIVSSGSGIAGSVRKSIMQYKKKTGKPVGAYAIGYSKNLGKTISQMDFCWFRDEKSLAKAVKDEISPADGWAPDAVFDFNVADERGAAEFLRENGLDGQDFLCCIPGFRYTPRWEFYGTGYDEKQDLRNRECQGPDNAILRAVVCEAVRKYGRKVLICAEQIPELRLCREEIYDKLPEDVKAACVLQTSMWSPQLALGVFRKSLCVFGIEMHSQVMAAGNGIPACIFRHKGFGSKSDMFRTVGLGDWLLDIDTENAEQKAVKMVSGILDNPEKAREKLKNAREIIDKARQNAVLKSF